MIPQVFYVYVHRRLVTGKPFYVGKGRANRSHQHCSRNPHWRNIVAKDGGFDVEFVAKKMEEELAFLVEVETIDKYRRLGVGLVNRTNGGDGVSGYRNPNGAHNKGKPVSEEMKARISATLKAKGCLPPIGWNKGQKTPPDVIEKRRHALRVAWAKVKSAGGRTVSPETREKMRAAKLGHVKSDETRRKLSEALKANKFVRKHPDMTGFKHSVESRAKMSASMRGRTSHRKGMTVSEAERARLTLISRTCPRPPLSEETKKKIGAAHKGLKASAETRERMRQAGQIKVECVETGAVFDSAMAASLWLGLNQKTQVWACCKGRLKSVRGYTFRYAEAAA